MKTFSTVTSNLRHLLRKMALVYSFVLLVPLLSGAQQLSNEDFTAASLKLRTALHYDSMLEQPLASLVDLYESADRTDELVGLYRSHTEQYPDDAGAKVVLIRIIQATDRSGVGELVASSVALHPEFPALQYLLFSFLEEKGDERSVEALSKAIDLQTNPARRSEWLEELLQLSSSEKARALASEQLAKLLTYEEQSAESFLATAKLMQRYSFWNLSRQALGLALEGDLSPEAKIEAEILLSRAEAESGNRSGAGTILDKILKRLSPDHWRRQEIITMRVGVIASTEERDAMLEDFRATFVESPDSENAALEYAEILVASEMQSKAAEVLVQAASFFTSGGLMESRAVDLIHGIGDLNASEAFLEARLEDDPERADLRFQLVKVHYALGRDADAEQDFKVVVAGLEEEGASKRILELQRYLRSIERMDAASVYLEQYVRNYPRELSVARELAEIYESRQNRSAVDALIGRLIPGEATPESVRDLVEFLIAEQYFVSAREVLGAKLAQGESDFELGLLQVVVLSELGDGTATAALVSKTREMTDTPARYSQWLDAAVVANENLERLDQFFDNEQNRFSFTTDQWPEDKVEKFVILCEAGRQRLLTDRVASSVRDQLAQGTFDAKLRIRLRRFLVGVLESSPDAGAEVDEQLQLLATEDPENKTRYDLQRALVYHRTNRVDLAQDLLLGMNLTEVADAPLVQQAVAVLVEYRFLREAESALEAVNRLVPEDVFSWEKRLTLLASLQNEEEFRAVVRSLQEGSAGVELREESISALSRHLAASYWRTISRLIATGDPRRFEEILPILASVNRASDDFRNRAWTEWSRAIVLGTLGRTEESDEAMERLLASAEELKQKDIVFPDGMRLSLEGAKKLLNPLSVSDESETAEDPEFLSSSPQTKWAFEADYGSRIIRTGATGDVVLALDDRGVVYAVDLETGKLLWREQFGSIAKASQSKANLFFGKPNFGESGALPPERSVKLARPFVVKEGNFYLIERGSLHAYSAISGEAIWSGEIPFESPSDNSEGRVGASPGFLLEVDGGRAVVSHPETGHLACFDTASGKLLWLREGTDGGGESKEVVVSLNSGLQIDQEILFAFGRQSVVIDLETGEPLWNLAGESEMIFPVLLRKRRDEGGAQLGEDDSNADEEERWKSGVRAAREGNRQFIDFLSDQSNNPAIPSLSGDGSTTALVNPAVYWAVARLEDGQSAHAHLEGGYLWLMQRESVKRISVRLPVASRELPASGSFLGRVENHAWFLDGRELHHLDFAFERVHSVNCANLGPSLRAAVVGNQIVVRGKVGFKLINALTGRVIGASQWSEELSAFLADTDLDEQDGKAPVVSTWQGEIRFSESGEPNYCLPVNDLAVGTNYITRFGENTLVCLAKKLSNPTPGNGDAN
ncbi:MAG: PQQ-binding-like beta-propeller repeat protein [Verrucomicrobiales bacterium]|nr:PQQ-binding-like beta-propeller repeat protein [Verrucomicrobiales bacterium]